ncbi:DNA polymerase III subunit alpha [Terrilactibacillus laevilacticus]|uniref:DNA polymerase III subunit alpha n=1 Tax=Terrilactibacillus laevilacticus TaxID=1380157 RepID=A0ABW5PT00_9BACI|nr:DNA polymerase III subunit alpha [Terrilactibacillus laevilacticus]
MTFVHLHVHSEYSLLDSTCRMRSLVERAKTMGYKALALTDKQTLYGTIPFYKACLENDIHPVIGIEVYMEVEHDVPKRREDWPEDYSIVLLAKNQQGYRNLVEISSIIQQKSVKRLKRTELETYSDGLIVLSSGTSGLIGSYLIQGRKEEAMEAVTWLHRTFQKDFYLEVQNHGEAFEREMMLEYLNYSKSFHISLVATNDVHYLDKADAKAYDCLTCIRTGSKIQNFVKKHKSTEYYFKSPNEMKQIFTSYPEAIDRTEEIAFQCQVKFDFDALQLPKYKIEGADDASSLLRKLCMRGLAKRYSRLTDEIQSRLEKELAIIHDMGFDDYFLIVWDLLAYARKNEIEPGPGRGSAAGSLVAYLLHITDVDPIKYQLLFERFLNPERVTMPDIDIDFPDRERDKMISYVSQKYGSDHVAQIITFGTLAAKAAIRDVGKVLDIDGMTMNKVAKSIPSRPGITLQRAIEESAELRQLIKQSKEIEYLLTLSQKVEGVPRHSSIHAAGVVISEKPLKTLVPTQPGHDDVMITQFPMENLEELGLLKIDFLGLRNLTLIQDVLALIQDHTGQKIDLSTIPMDDSDTFKMLSEGDTTGVFQLESDGMRAVLKRLLPNTFEDIVAVNALYRPGPMNSTQVYIDCKHGKKAVQYPHPDLAPILKMTYGVIVYQEQIMSIANVMAGYSLGQADILRRAVSKKKRHILDEQKQSFILGCQKNGYTKQLSESVYDLIVRFADYGFNRSHAVAYSLIAYRMAYLKVHYPKAFITAHLSSVHHDQDKCHNAINEAKRKGMVFFPPSINHSGAYFTWTEKGIRFGLGLVKGVGNKVVQDILMSRKKGPFKSLFDFCRRVSLTRVNRKAIESLIFAGAMDEFGIDRAILLATLENAMHYSEKYTHTNVDQVSFEMDEVEPEYIQVPPLSEREKIEYEKEALGIFVSAHPIEPFRWQLSKQMKTIDWVKSQTNGTSVVLGAVIEKNKCIRTKKGQMMSFLTLSDETGQLEAICFPNVHEENTRFIQNGQLLFVKGTLEIGQHEKKLIVKQMMDLEQYMQSRVARVFIRIDKEHEKNSILKHLHDVLQLHPGAHPVIIHYGRSGKTVQLPDQYRLNIEKSTLNKLKNIIGHKNVIIKSI